MTTKETEQLNAWIGLHVMGWTREDVKPSRWFPDGAKNAWLTPRGSLDTLPSFTKSPADAMAVLEACAKKCPVVCWHNSRAWCVADNGRGEGEDDYTDANTLPLAICRFAKKLFEK